MSRPINRVVCRPQANATWSVEWPWRRRGQQMHNTRTTVVAASFAADMDEEAPMDVPLPNNITVSLQHKDPDRQEQMRFTREGAELLIEQLQSALAWNGQ